MTRDLRNSESRTPQECSKKKLWNLPGLQTDAIGEQQSKRTPPRAAVEAEAIGEQQQPKRTQSGNS